MTYFFDISYQFLNLAKGAIDEMGKMGNSTTVISEGLIYDEVNDEINEYNEKTKWSDINIAIPVLFNFFHGVELYMKALLDDVNILPKNQKKGGHKLTAFLNLVKSNKENYSDNIINVLELSISKKNPFYYYFEKNNLDFDEFYIALRYPEPRKGDKFNYEILMGQRDIGLVKFKELGEIIIKLKEAIIEWKTN